MAASQKPEFSRLFNSEFRFGKEEELTGRFGLNVLDDLVDGIDKFKSEAASLRTSPRDAGPAMLGAFGWLDDPQLLQRIADFPHACVAFTKDDHPMRPHKRARLRSALERCHGFPAAALPELETLALRDEGGKPQVVGPSTRLPRLTIPGLRAFGYRKTAGQPVPLLHAKMVLLGDLRWQDEDEFGYPADILFFEPRRLWTGSANGTAASRLSLEWGCWQTEPQLFIHAKRFLTQVIAHSEDFDPDSDDMNPELVEFEYDDAAMIEALADAEDVWDEEHEPE